MASLSETSTASLLEELLSRDGVEYDEVNAGIQIEYTPPKDAYFIVVPPEAMPHKETPKERQSALKAKFMERLMQDYTDGRPDAGALLVQLLKE